MEKDTEKTYDFTSNNGGQFIMDEQVVTLAAEFVEKLKQTDVYLNYWQQVKKIQNYQDLQRQIDDFRKENFEIQSRYEGDELFDKADELNIKYEKFRENPIVSDFLAAELAFCRMMQDVNTYITEGLEFQ